VPNARRIDSAARQNIKLGGEPDREDAMGRYSFLLGPAAFCLLAGVLGIGISALFLTSPHKDELNAGRVGLVAGAVLLGYGSLSLGLAFALAHPSRRTGLRVSFRRWMVVAAVMLVPTAVLFGPSGGFHHHYGFGPLPFFYMVWNGEDPAPGSFQIVKGYEVWFDPVRFGLLFAVWVVLLAALTIGIIRPARDSAK
jgi:hypothetical protein